MGEDCTEQLLLSLRQKHHNKERTLVITIAFTRGRYTFSTYVYKMVGDMHHIKTCLLKVHIKYIRSIPDFLSD